MKAFVHRAYVLAWALLALTAGFLVFASTPAVAQWLQARVAIARPDSRSPYPRADVIVVLGGGEVVNEAKTSHWDADATRLGVGRAMLLDQRAPLILLSGGDGEAEQMASHLISDGVPRTRILIENRSRDTHENALDSVPMLRSIGAHRILLVTSAIHMRRAAACFEKLGFEVLQAPASEQPLPAHDDFWSRRESALVRSGHCIHEIFGLWFYRLCGWA